MSGRQLGIVLIALLTGLSSSLLAEDGQENELWHYRNLGKAFYENPTTQYQAVEMFKKALDLAPGSPRELVNYGLALLRAGKTDEGIQELLAAQKADPRIPHTWFNLGIVYKKAAQYEKSREEFEEMVRLVPDEPISHYNLGVILKLTGDSAGALKEFERAAELDPNLAGPYFQIYNAYRAAGRTADAQEAFKKFQENKRKQASSAVPEDLDWSYYSEILDVIDPMAAPQDSARNFPTAADFQPSPSDLQLAGTPLGLELISPEQGTEPAVLAWSDQEVRLLPALGGESRRVFKAESGKIRTVAPGDFDNDGKVDFCVILDRGIALLRTTEQGFQRIDCPVAENAYSAALWMDFDHDSDLDLFLLGKKSSLFRNDGNSGFSDQTPLFPFVDGEAVVGCQVDLVKDTNGTDLVMAYADRSPVLYRDRLAGLFAASDLPGVDSDTTRLHSVDLNNDGWTDLLGSSEHGVRVYWNHSGQLEASDLVVGSRPIALADLGNRGFLDIVSGDHLFRNDGQGHFNEAATIDSMKGARRLVAGDLDADGRVDLAFLDANGTLRALRSCAKPSADWLEVQLTGVRNPRLAPGAEVEVKAGRLYQKRIYEGVPLHFGLGTFGQVDTVRITWPNGLIQNETEQPVGKLLTFKEKQRLSGSCPMVFTWNGSRFQFITDVLGVAPLGAAAGDGVYFPVDHDEYIQIPPGALEANDNGDYEVRVTEELREVSFLDQIRLIAVDHPEGTSIFTSDKFKSPPYPKFRLFGVRDRHYPVRARDDRGDDVRAALLKRDRRYPAGFSRDMVGVAEPHSLIMDFGPGAAPDNRAILVLNGWVDWADGSTIRRISQDRTSGFIMPYLQVKDGDGNWQTVVDDMGVPAGKPKTIVVDLTGKFLSASRQVRIVTSLCVYWDEAFLSEDVGPPQVSTAEPRLRRADLHFRGFSTTVVHPQRTQPERFEYAKWRPESMWNPTPGLYTRYGEVAPVLSSIDDEFVIMGSGDELQLLFPSRSLPPLKEGWVREFLLFVDGWAKDGDLNTAFSQTVEPLPFHGMSGYPYRQDEHYPNDDAHRRYRSEYNTRPALRLLRSLVEEHGIHRPMPEPKSN
ncbi:MAG: tetratricopeptide repeat protein [Acidobacteriota bacterium]